MAKNFPGKGYKGSGRPFSCLNCSDKLCTNIHGITVIYLLRPLFLQPLALLISIQRACCFCIVFQCYFAVASAISVLPLQRSFLDGLDFFLRTNSLFSPTSPNCGVRHLSDICHKRMSNLDPQHLVDYAMLSRQTACIQRQTTM